LPEGRELARPHCQHAELDGKKGLYQCIADKKTDGSYKVTF